MLRVGHIGALEKLQKFSQALKLTKLSNIDFPDDGNLMTTLAYLELANNNMQAAKQQLQVIQAQGVSNFLVVGTRANIAMQEKDYQQAIDLYGGLYEKTPEGGNAINLARALQFSQQINEAERVLENYLIKQPKDNRVRMLLAELYGVNNIDNKKSDKIINLYKAIVTAQPNNVTALNNLAWQQYQGNDLSNAKVNIEKALNLSPDNIAIQESYGVILVASKQYKKGINLLTGVVGRGSLDVSAKVSLAEAYIATNKIEQAKAILSGLSSHDSELNIKITRLKRELGNN